jgi:hypothetical protein
MTRPTSGRLGKWNAVKVKLKEESHEDNIT